VVKDVLVIELVSPIVPAEPSSLELGYVFVITTEFFELKKAAYTTEPTREFPWDTAKETAVSVLFMLAVNVTVCFTKSYVYFMEYSQVPSVVPDG